MLELTPADIDRTRRQYLAALQIENPLEAYHQFGSASFLLARERGVHPIRILIAAAAEIYGVDPAAILGKRRRRAETFARHYVMYHARRDLELSYPEIGRRVGGRDHSTAIHGYQVHGMRHRLPVKLSARIRDRDLSVAYEGPEPTLAMPYEPIDRSGLERAEARAAGRAFWQLRLQTARVRRTAPARPRLLHFQPNREVRRDG